MLSSVAIPRAMRAAVLYDVDDLRIEERAVPSLEPGDVLVRTGASGICSGDLMPWYVRRKAPFVLGHEPAGTVVALQSEDDDDELLGARVFAHHHAPCLTCALCSRGDFVQCAHWRATSLDPGGMAEFFRVPRANVAELLILPDDMSFVAGSLIEPLACVVKSLTRGGAKIAHPTDAAFDLGLANRSVYVVGLGVMGLMHVALAVALGAAVFASDLLPERRALASALGAGAFEPDAAIGVLKEATLTGGADIVVCGPGDGTALQHSVAAAGPGGTVVMFSPIEPNERFLLDQASAYFRDLRLVASYSCGPRDTARARDLLSVGLLEPGELGLETAPLNGVSELYRRMREAEIVKGVVTFDGE